MASVNGQDIMDTESSVGILKQNNDGSEKLRMDQHLHPLTTFLTPLPYGNM